MMRPAKVHLALIHVCVITLLLTSVCFAQSKKDALLRPIVGSRMVVGNGKIADYTLQCFDHLCKEEFPNVVVISLDGKARVNEAKLKKYGADTVAVIDSVAIDATELTLTMLKAHGVWIEGNTDAIAENELMIANLNSVFERGGVVAVGPKSHGLLARLGEIDPSRRLESPFARFEFHFGQAKKIDAPVTQTTAEKVHCLVPDSSVVVFHTGREIAGYGDDISVLVRKKNGWPARRDRIECPRKFNARTDFLFGLDLFSWIRSANERARPVFPPVSPAEPEVALGNLVLSGSTTANQSILEEFIELAGGKDSRIVIIPSEGEGELRAPIFLKDMRVNFTIMRVDNPVVANQKEEFARLLKQASGVWIEGGRTFKFMDCYQGTQVETLIADVLKRGGVVGGHGCGSQVISDFMVRANPLTNRDIVFEGYTRGLGLLKGTVVDVVFSERRRQKQLHELVQQHPQMLGIGIDNDTALIVQGHTGRVVGENAVWFYDLRSNPGDDFKPVVLKAGEKYDLKSRSKLP